MHFKKKTVTNLIKPPPFHLFTLPTTRFSTSLNSHAPVAAGFNLSSSPTFSTFSRAIFWTRIFRKRDPAILFRDRREKKRKEGRGKTRRGQDQHWLVTRRFVIHRASCNRGSSFKRNLPPTRSLSSSLVSLSLSLSLESSDGIKRNSVRTRISKKRKIVSDRIEDWINSVYLNRFFSFCKRTVNEWLLDVR